MKNPAILAENSIFLPLQAKKKTLNMQIFCNLNLRNDDKTARNLPTLRYKKIQK